MTSGWTTSARTSPTCQPNAAERSQRGERGGPSEGPAAGAHPAASRSQSPTGGQCVPQAPGREAVRTEQPKGWRFPFRVTEVSTLRAVSDGVSPGSKRGALETASGGRAGRGTCWEGDARGTCWKRWLRRVCRAFAGRGARRCPLCFPCE